MDLKTGTASSSKCQKNHGEGKQASTEVVGIGRLPDAMLCHILSFLRTEDAVRASFLSKRWRYAWTSVPCIDIYYIAMNNPKGERCLHDFLEKILHLNTVSCLRKLSLNWSINNNQLIRLIHTVMERDIEEIVLDVSGQQCMKLPTSTFTSEKLVILRLSSSIILDVPSLVYLPCLKILHLYLEAHFREESVKKLLDGCPVIEELNIQGVGMGDYNVKTLLVSSSSLKSLRVWSFRNALRIVIDLPNIEQLDLTDHGNAQFDLNDLSSLVKLNITIGEFSRLVELPGKFINTEYIQEIVLNLKGSQCVMLPPSLFTSKKLVILSLSSSIILDVPSLVYLPCLKILHLYLGKHFDKNPIKKLLAGCPVIEELNIQDVGDNVKTLFVRSSSLRSLRILSDRLIDLRIVDVPNVFQLDLIDDGKAQNAITIPSSLVKSNTNTGGSQLVDLLGKFTNTEYIEEIVLNFGGNQCVKLPPSIFTCKMLMILKLCSRIILDVPSSVNLPSLKILHIHITDVIYKDFMMKLVDGCPVIEELKLWSGIILDVPSSVYLRSLKILHLYLENSFDGVSMKNIIHGSPVLEQLNIQIVEYGASKKRKNVTVGDVQTLFVLSPSMKSLSFYSSNSGRLRDLRIVVDGPNVERLHLRDNGNVQYDIKSLSSLVKLYINIGQVSRLVELLGKFTNAEYMVISFETMKILKDQPLDDFPMFHNLAHLKINSHDFRRLVLPALLECMPNLVTLVSHCGQGRFRELPLHHFKAPKCMMLYLEEIELRGFKGFWEEMEMISYFLKNSMVLKKLSIYTCYAAGGVRFAVISQELLTFRRTSPECQIIFK